MYTPVAVVADGEAIKIERFCRPMKKFKKHNENEKDVKIHCVYGYLAINSKGVESVLERISAAEENKMQTVTKSKAKDFFQRKIRKQSDQYERVMFKLFGLIFEKPTHLKVPSIHEKKIKVALLQLHESFIERQIFISQSLGVNYLMPEKIQFLKFRSDFLTTPASKSDYLEELINDFLIVYPRELPIEKANQRSYLAWTLSDPKQASLNCIRYLKKNDLIDWKKFGFHGEKKTNDTSLRNTLKRAAIRKLRKLKKENQLNKQWLKFVEE